MRKMKKEDATVSLFDYQGFPVGKGIGKEVYELAAKLGEPVNSREVKTKTYSGKVLLYREKFLKYYFDDNYTVL